MGIDSYYSLGDSAVEALSVAAVVMAGAYLFWWLMFGRPAVKITGYMLQVQNPVRGYRVSRCWAETLARMTWANHGLRKMKLGGRGWGWGKRYRLALHAPHNVKMRHVKKAQRHVGRWHLHTGPNRTARHVFRFWKRMDP